MSDDPFAPAASAPGAGPQAPCARCGQSVPSDTLSYDDRAELVCRGCSAHSQIHRAQSTAGPTGASTAFVGSVGSLLIALSSCCMTHWVPFLFQALALVGAVGTMVTVLRTENARQTLGWKYPATIACGAVAAVVAVISTVLFIISP